LEQDVLKGLKFSYLQWTHDSLGFFYGAWDSSKNFDGHETKKLAFNKVYYHLVGTSEKEDKLIYENPKQKEERYHITVTNDGKYALLRINRRGKDLDRKIKIASL
jgi:prolyl oligopeptidase